MLVQDKNLYDDQLPQFDNSGHGKLMVPGFGYQVKTTLPIFKRFRHGIMDASYDRLTVKELAMLRLMDAITDKPNWKMKMRNPKIVGKWRVEAMLMPFMSEAAFDWCIEELQDNTDWNEDSFVLTLDTGSRCAKADNVVPEHVQHNLQKQILPLLAQPKDWHPGSKGQALDLVHPSFYPLVYGKTRIKPQGIVKLNEMLVGNKTSIILPALDKSEWPIEHTHDWYKSKRWSHEFQWLPCEVKFVEDIATKVKITSYINNLRPDLHKDLYHTIERIIGYSVPAWNEVLMRSAQGRTSRRIQQRDHLSYNPRLPNWASDLASHKSDARWEDDVKKVKEYCQLPEIAPPANIDRRHQQLLHDSAMVYEGPGPHDWENGDEFGPSLWSVVESKYLHLKKIVHPDPGPDAYWEWKQKQWKAKQWDFKHQKEGEEPNPYPVSLENEFRGLGLQVIVKLASIELTPERPNYPGGNWHLEGSLSEHIVATAIYYFDVCNVSESRIRFRQEATLDVSSQRDDRFPDLFDFSEIWGISRDEWDSATQEIGSIKTPQGRLLAFPNTLQHRVEPFRLLDPAKPGHRRFLVLWLVDPNYRLMSTQNVPPQQFKWQRDQALAILERKKKLPPEVLAIIGEKMEEIAPFSLKEARKFRRELMQERVITKETIDSSIPSYNLCEH